MPITAAHRDLRRRQREIVKMLRPIRAGPDVGCVPGAGPGARTIVLCAHEGVTQARDYRDARFRTRAHGIWAQYFELWQERAQGDNLILNTVCFNVYWAEPSTRKFDELVCIHSEPPDESNMKRGPHLHVMRADQPIPKCHFPLNYQNLKETLQSARTLTEAIRAAIEIVDQEVIERFCDGKAP